MLIYMKAKVRKWGIFPPFFKQDQFGGLIIQERLSGREFLEPTGIVLTWSVGGNTDQTKLLDTRRKLSCPGIQH